MKQIVDVIKAENKRRLNEYKEVADACSYRTDSYIMELKEPLFFIDTLEDEQDVFFKKELEAWRHEHFKGERDRECAGEYLYRSSQLALARHFYELGLNTRKENKI